VHVPCLYPFLKLLNSLEIGKGTKVRQDNEGQSITSTMDNSHLPSIGCIIYASTLITFVSLFPCTEFPLTGGKLLISYSEGSWKEFDFLGDQ